MSLNIDDVTDQTKLKLLANIVPVVRCKYCKWYIDNTTVENSLLYCRWRTDENPDDEDYCSYGEWIEE